MGSASLLLVRFPGDVLRSLLEHIEVTVLVAVIILLIGFFRKRLIDFSSLFVAIGIYGEWETTLTKNDAEAKREHCDGPSIEPNQQGLEKPHEYVKLHQFFNKVWGKARRHDDSSVIYKLRGQIIGEKLSMVYREADGFDSGAVLLDIESRTQMQGFEIGRDLKSGEVYFCPYKWRRRKSV